MWDSWRAFRQTVYRPHRAQRWALGLPTPLSPQLIWLHAVSVGETQACAPLLRALLAQYPHHCLLLTHMTPTGRDTGAALFVNEIAQSRVQQCYLPYDIWGLPQRFLAHFKPCAGMMMETEIWPNLVTACKTNNIPLGLANARMSEKTTRRTQRLKRIAQQTFQQFSWIAAQSEMDAKRLAQLADDGVITITGNLKFDVIPNDAQLAHGKAFKQQQNRSIIALASTREGEEAMLLSQLQPWLRQQINKPLILLIPRHPKRAAELTALLQSNSWQFCQRSMGETPTAQTELYLCDTLGEMWFYYGASDIALVGGGWLPHGGQNLIEPCMAGCAVITGAHMFNFAHATTQALQADAIVQCQTIAQLNGALDHLLHAPNRQVQVDNGLKFAKAHTGATQAHIALLNKYVAHT